MLEVSDWGVFFFSAMLMSYTSTNLRLIRCLSESITKYLHIDFLTAVEKIFRTDIFSLSHFRDMYQTFQSIVNLAKAPNLTISVITPHTFVPTG